MITSITYDDGRRRHMPTIGLWTKPMPPAWRCGFREDYRGQGEELEAWMKANMSHEYECIFRFNSGDPCYFITIQHEEDLTAFRLRWA